MSEVFLMYVVYVYCSKQYCTICKYYEDPCIIGSDFLKQFEKFRQEFKFHFTEIW